MAELNIQFAWCWFFVGVVSGAVQGLWFHDEQWLGGYSSWPRRMTRLGHIAFFGTGLLNLCFGLTLLVLPNESRWYDWASPMLIAGAVFMPGVCYLSAWRKALRRLFVVPVACLGGGVAFTAVGLLWA